MNAGQAFLQALVDEDVADCCRQFIGYRITDRHRAGDVKSVTCSEIARAVVAYLEERHGIEQGRLAIGVLLQDGNISFMPGNLFTYLLMSGIKATGLHAGASSYATPAGTYFFDRGRGGRFVAAIAQPT